MGHWTRGAAVRLITEDVYNDPYNTPFHRRPPPERQRSAHGRGIAAVWPRVGYTESGDCRGVLDRSAESLLMPTQAAMDLRHGFTLNKPPITVPWDSSEQDLQRLLGAGLHFVVAGYWTIRAEVLGGLQCNLGFHFDKDRGVIKELEFFRDSYADEKGSFDEFQEFFERAFGKPTEAQPGSEGFPFYRWVVSGAEIRHYVF